MSRTIPITEPTQARAGDTWEWTKSLSDYPASTWTLSYVLYNSAGVINIAASDDGATHTVNVAPATTGAYTAGRYDWTSSVTDGTDVYQVGSGVIQVLPDLSAVSTYDGRSHSRTMLDAINATLEGKATSSQLHLVRSEINGRSVQWSIEQLIKLRQHYAAAVRMEDDAVKIARGDNPGRFIATRFIG